MSWQGRIAQQTRLGNPDHLATLVTSGFAAGGTPADLAKQIRPFVQDVASTARRVARNESMRIAHETRMEAYEQLGDMVIAYQIHATMDTRVRPEHAARSGNIYYKKPTSGQLGMDKMPRPPLEEDGTVAHNCRCWLTPVLEVQKHIEEDPAAKAVFTNAKGKLVPNPAVYTDWFHTATEVDQKRVVGARRLKLLKVLLPNEKITWGHFVDPESGRLMDEGELHNETPQDRQARLIKFQGLIAKRKELTQKVANYGYLPPEPPPQPVPVIAPVIVPPPPPKPVPVKQASPKPIKAPITPPVVPQTIPPAPFPPVAKGSNWVTSGTVQRRHELLTDAQRGVIPINGHEEDKPLKRVAAIRPDLEMDKIIIEYKSTSDFMKDASLFLYEHDTNKAEDVQRLMASGNLRAVAASIAPKLSAEDAKKIKDAAHDYKVALELHADLNDTDFVKNLKASVAIKKAEIKKDPAKFKRTLIDMVDGKDNYLDLIRGAPSEEVGMALLAVRHDMLAHELEHEKIDDPEDFKTFRPLARKFFETFNEHGNEPRKLMVELIFVYNKFSSITPGSTVKAGQDFGDQYREAQHQVIFNHLAAYHPPTVKVTIKINQKELARAQVQRKGRYGISPRMNVKDTEEAIFDGGSFLTNLVGGADFDVPVNFYDGKKKVVRAFHLHGKTYLNPMKILDPADPNKDPKYFGYQFTPEVLEAIRREQKAKQSETMVHESGHVIEQDPEIKKMCQAFLNYRRGSENPTYYRNVPALARYKISPYEMGIEDDFAKTFGPDGWYVGKIYKSGSTEILSMGLEMLKSNPIHFFEKDAEYANFCIQVVRFYRERKK